MTIDTLSVPAAQKSLVLALFVGAAVLTGCSVVRTTADVVVGTAKVASTVVSTTANVAATAVTTTADVAKSAANTGIAAGNLAVSAASAAKTVTLATASVAISGVSLIGNAVMWSIQMKKSDEFLHAPVISTGSGRFVSSEGKLLQTNGCAEIAPQAPGVLVYSKSGQVEVRAGSAICPVVSVG